MINIRSNVFETNSSSTHSVTIDFSEARDKLETIVPDKNGNIVLKGGDYSCAEYFSKEALDKANFLAVYATVHNDRHLIKLLIEILKEQTGAKEILFDIRFVTTDSEKLNSYYSSDYDDLSCKVSNGDYDYEYEEFSKVKEDKDLLKKFIFDEGVSLDAGTDDDR